MKKYAKTALVYAVLAMVGGVFFREFTKFNSYGGGTTLSVIHPHYFMLGTVVFLLLTVFQKLFSFTTDKTKYALISYHVGLNLTAVMFYVRGILQVTVSNLSKGASSAISGIAGIGHIVLGISLIILLVQIVKGVCKNS